MSRGFPGLGFDPAPGDPELVRRCAREHVRAATELDSLATALTSAGALSASWRGAAATAFTAALAPLPAHLRNAAQSFGTIAVQLTAWAGELEELQAQARQLERAAEEAFDRLRSAHARAAIAPAAGNPLFAGSAHVVDGAEAQEDLRRLTLRAEDVRAAWRAAGRRVAAAIEAAAEAAPAVPRSVGQLVWEHREGLALASDACALLSLPALPVPVAGPALSTGLGLASTAGYTALAVHADGSQVDVAIGAGVLGIGGAGAVARQVARTTPAAAVGAHVTARTADVVGGAVSAVGSALTVRKRVTGPGPDGAGSHRSSAHALQRLLLAPVQEPPSRKRR